MSDDTQTPNHYLLPELGCEVVDVIRAALGPEGFRAYCRGTALAYLLRAGKKAIAPAAQDQVKAGNYCFWAAGHDPRIVVDLTASAEAP